MKAWILTYASVGKKIQAINPTTNQLKPTLQIKRTSYFFNSPHDTAKANWEDDDTTQLSTVLRLACRAASSSLGTRAFCTKPHRCRGSN